MSPVWSNLTRRFATIFVWGAGLVYAAIHLGVDALVTIGDLDSASRNIPRWLEWLLSTPWWVPAIVIVTLTAFMIWTLWPRTNSQTRPSSDYQYDTDDLSITLIYDKYSDIPVLVDKKNLFRYYSLSVHMRSVIQENISRSPLITCLFIVYNDPVRSGNVKVTNLNGQATNYEIRDYSERHSLILFEGSLRGSTLKIETY